MEKKGKLRIVQFIAMTFSDRGGGERVQRALYDVFGAPVYTFKKRVSGEEIREVGTEVDRRVFGKPPSEEEKW